MDANKREELRTLRQQYANLTVTESHYSRVLRNHARELLADSEMREELLAVCKRVHEAFEDLHGLTSDEFFDQWMAEQDGLAAVIKKAEGRA